MLPCAPKGSGPYFTIVVICIWPSLAGAQEPVCNLVSRFDSISQDATIAALEATLDTAQNRRPDAFLDRFATEWDRRATTGEVYAALAGCFLQEIPEGSFARSFSSATSNPAAGNLLERSGFSDLFSLAVDGLFFGSDETAVTINLNALALFGIGKDSVYTSPSEFQKAGPLRRWGGSFTFGERVPKKAVTGFSGFPDADSLFEAMSWDVRVRVLGDRDPRASQWEKLLKEVAVQGNRTATLLNVVGQLVADTDRGTELGVDGAFLEAVLTAVEGRQGRTLEDVTRQIKNSWQVTLKAAGQHVAEMGDADKWSLTLLADRGIGDLGDVTFNATYSRSTAGAGENGGGASAPLLSRLIAFQDSVGIEHLDKLEINAGFTSTVLQDAMVPGRGAELAVAGRLEIPIGDDVRGLMSGGDAMMIDLERSTAWKANITLTLPISNSGKLPISLTYTNDPDALMDRSFVEGRLGLAWDFAAITSALKRLAGS